MPVEKSSHLRLVINNSGRARDGYFVVSDFAARDLVNALRSLPRGAIHAAFNPANSRGGPANFLAEDLKRHFPFLSPISQVHKTQLTGYVSVVQQVFTSDGMDGIAHLANSLPMPRRRPTYLREWRKHRHRTQEQLAHQVGMSAANLSRIETGDQNYTQETLESLAAALNCAPADILSRDPSSPQGELLSEIDRLGPEDARQLLAFIHAIKSQKSA